MKRLDGPRLHVDGQMAWFALALCLAGGFSPGCDSKLSAPATSESQAEPPVGLPSVMLIEGNSQTLASMLAKHRGKVVLVDFWATWCGPCVKQFPHLIELSSKHREAGLAVVSVSMNEPKDREAVLAFLKRQKADFDNLLPEYGAGSRFLEAFDLRGDVPFYKLYDSQGVLRYTFSDDPSGIENCQSIEKIDQRVADLLGEKRQ